MSMPSRPVRAARLLAVFTIMALAPVACSGDDGSGDDGQTGGPVSAEEYAQGLCGAASTWMTALQDRNTQLQEDLGTASQGDLAGIKDLMVAFLDGAVQDTQILIDDVSGMAAPDVDDGQQIHDSLLGAFTQARDLFAGARDQVADLDPSDPTAFTQTLTELGTTLSDAGTEIAGSVEGLQNEELTAAFDETPACAEVGA